MSGESSNDPAVINLQNYIRIRSDQPNVNYDECIEYLKGQARELGLKVQIVEPRPRKPVLVMTWEGSEPRLPSIFLNSHMDVVPVFEENWTYPPFEARIVDGMIYARGSQDMKSIAISYIEAVRRLKSKGVILKRTVHMTFVSDEELGGKMCMAEFVKMEEFRNLNVGFALDEGNPSPDDAFFILNAEKTPYHVQITCLGKSGHASLLHPDNSGAKLRYIIDKFMDLREEGLKKLTEDPTLMPGDVTSVNLTVLSGGGQNNVVPQKLTANFDVRLSIDFHPEDFEEMINKWCEEAGPNVTIKYPHRDSYIPPTALDETNPFWIAFKAAADKMNLTLVRKTRPSNSDTRYVRQLGIPALGFSPINNTTPRLHDDNEYIPVNVFLRGIGIYEELIKAVANV